MTDEEAITIALLLGCKFASAGDGVRKLYYAESTDGPIHPVELHNRRASEGPESSFGFKTKGDLARAYIKYLKVELPTEVTP